MKLEKISKVSKTSKLNRKNLTKIKHSRKIFKYFLGTKLHKYTGLESIFDRPANPLAKLKSFHVITSLVTYSLYIQILACVLAIHSWQRVPKSVASRPKMIALNCYERQKNVSKK